MILIVGLAAQRCPSELFANHLAVGAVGPQDTIDRRHGRLEALFAPGKGLICQMPFSDIPKEYREASVLNRERTRFEPRFPTVRPLVAVLERDRHPLRHRLLVEPANLVMLGIRVGDPMRLADDGFTRASVDAHRFAVQFENNEVGRKQPKALVHAVHDQTQPARIGSCACLHDPFPALANCVPETRIRGLNGGRSSNHIFVFLPRARFDRP